MDVMTRLANSIVVPVVVLDKVEDAVPTAKAMAAGGVDTMEITFRTACAPEAIKAVAENCPEVCVGAGTVLNLEQAKLAIEMGAKFIVSPGYSEEVVSWCVENNIPVAPGCVTPTEIYTCVHTLSLHDALPIWRLDSLEAAQGAPRDPRRDSRGERSPWLPLETRPDSPGQPGMQPRDPCLPWRGILGPGHTPR